MHRRLAYALVAAFLAAAPAPAQLADPSPEAMTFVAGFADAHLAGLLARAAGGSTELAALAQTDYDAVERALDAEIGAAVARHGPEWQRNMALAWTPLLTEAEMASLAFSGAQSPHVEKYMSLRAEAGQAMQVLSAGLFETVLSDVVAGAIRRASAQ